MSKRIVVIGAGPGGYVAAIRAAQMGASVTVIEDTEVGGTCLNRGCIPTKSLIASVEALAGVRAAEDYGIEVRGEIVPNVPRIYERAGKTVALLAKGIRALFKSRNISLIEGKGSLVDRSTVSVMQRDGQTSRFEADAIIIATGSNPSRPSLFPFDGKKVLTSDDALRLTTLPKSMIIVGAGVIGCEWACIFRELGVEVTMVEMMPRALATEDEEISELLERELKKKKIRLLTGVRIERMEVVADLVTASLGEKGEVSAETALISVGRTFNTDGLNLDAVGVKRGGRGEIAVNSRMETSVAGIYAVGDVTGGILLAHVASKEGIVAAENIMGHNATMDYSVVPSGIFTLPEIGSVGLREFEAKERGILVKVGRFPFRALGRAMAAGEYTGMVKVIAHGVTDRILGVHIMGPHAADLIHEAVVAMNKGMTAAELGHTIHAHPTFAEAFMEAAEDVEGNCIHLPKRQQA
ncbi:MAG: dihydrolipoyl dehydrogenase [Nitrospirota bacterium]|nr:dihydrolipoyl dehydrogenase [Nitrospirota bacterium]